METFKAARRGDRHVTPETVEYRYMTAEEAKHLSSGGTADILDQHGRVASVKVNGTPKTWKTRPHDVDVPWKFGLYEYGKEEFRAGRLTTLLICRIN